METRAAPDVWAIYWTVERKWHPITRAEYDKIAAAAAGIVYFTPPGCSWHPSPDAAWEAWRKHLVEQAEFHEKSARNLRAALASGPKPSLMEFQFGVNRPGVPFVLPGGLP